MTAHLDDLTMIRLIDESESEPHRSRATEHLVSCPICRGEMAELRRRMARMSELLAATDPPVPALAFPTAPVARWPRQLIAAGVIGLLAAGMLVRPVRGLITDLARNAWSIVAGAPDRPADTTPTAETEVGTATVEYMPQEPRLAIIIATRQASGTITITRGERGPIRATVLRGGAREGILVVPGGLRVDNDPASTADYLLRVPETVDEVTLTVAGNVIARIDAADEPGEWTIDLGR